MKYIIILFFMCNLTISCDRSVQPTTNTEESKFDKQSEEIRAKNRIYEIEFPKINTYHKAIDDSLLAVENLLIKKSDSLEKLGKRLAIKFSKATELYQRIVINNHQLDANQEAMITMLKRQEVNHARLENNYKWRAAIVDLEEKIK